MKGNLDEDKYDVFFEFGKSYEEEIEFSMIFRDRQKNKEEKWILIEKEKLNPALKIPELYDEDFLPWFNE